MKQTMMTDSDYEARAKAARTRLEDQCEEIGQLTEQINTRVWETAHSMIARGSRRDDLARVREQLKEVLAGLGGAINE